MYSYDCIAYMDYMDLAAHCPRKGVKLFISHEQAV